MAYLNKYGLDYYNTLTYDQVLENIAPIEWTTTASQTYLINDYLIYRGQLYKVIQNIKKNDTIIFDGNDKNCIITNVFNEVKTCLSLEETITNLLGEGKKINWSDLGNSTYSTGWREGYWRLSDGAFITSNQYLATCIQDTLSFSDYNFMTITPPSNYYIWAIEYDSAKNFLNTYGIMGVIGKGKTLFIPITQGNYYVFSIGKFENSDADEYNRSNWLDEIVCKCYISNTQNFQQIQENTITKKTNTTNYTMSIGYINATTGAPQGTNLKYRRTARIKAYEPGLKKIILKPKIPNARLRVYYYSNSISLPLATYFIEANNEWESAIEILPSENKPYMIVSIVADTVGTDLSGYNYNDLIEEIREYSTAEVIENIEAKDNPIYILGIGNSYTYYSFAYLVKILQELGYTHVVVGMGYKGGVTLAEQYNNRTNANFYATTESSGFYLWSNNGVKSYEYDTNFSLQSILQAQPWTHIIIQQQSDESGQYHSFSSSSFDINNLLDFINNYVPNAQIALTCPWTHATGYQGENFINYYNGDQNVMDAALREVIPQVAAHMTKCNYIINQLDAFKIARNNEFLKTIGNEMMRNDKNHPAYGIPMYLAACTIATTLFDLNINDLIWYPTLNDDQFIETTTSEYYSFLAKQCAIASKGMINIENIDKKISIMDKDVNFLSSNLQSNIQSNTYNFSLDTLQQLESSYIDDFTERLNVIDEYHVYTTQGDIEHPPNITTGVGLTRTGASGMTYLWYTRHFNIFPYYCLIGLVDNGAQHIKLYDESASNATSVPLIIINQSSRSVSYNGITYGFIHKTAKYCLWRIDQNGVNIIDDTGIIVYIPISYVADAPLTISLGFGPNNGRLFGYSSFVEFIYKPMSSIDIDKSIIENRESDSNSNVLTSVRFSNGFWNNGSHIANFYTVPEDCPAMTLLDNGLSNSPCIQIDLDYSNNTEYRSECVVTPIRVNNFSTHFGGLQRIKASADIYMPTEGNSSDDCLTYIAQIHNVNFVLNGWHDPPPFALRVDGNRLKAAVAYRADGSAPDSTDTYVSDVYDLCEWKKDTWTHIEFEVRIGWMASLAPKLIVKVDGIERLNIQTPIGFNIVSQNCYVDTRFGMYCPQWTTSQENDLRRRLIVTNYRWSGTQCIY